MTPVNRSCLWTHHIITFDLSKIICSGFAIYVTYNYVVCIGDEQIYTTTVGKLYVGSINKTEVL